MDPVSAKIGQPMKVTGGYRPQRMNNAVGGSKTSAHPTGRAADVITGGGGKDNLKIVKSLLSCGVNFDQCIIEKPTFNSKWEIVSAQWIHLGMSSSINRRQMLYYYNGQYKTANIKTDYTFTK